MDVISSTFDISGNDAMKNNHVANWLANISTNGEGDVLMFSYVCEGTQRNYQLPKTYFDQLRCERSSIRTKLTDHVKNHVVLHPGEVVPVTSPNFVLSNSPPAAPCPQVVRFKPRLLDSLVHLQDRHFATVQYIYRLPSRFAYFEVHL